MPKVDAYPRRKTVSTGGDPAAIASEANVTCFTISAQFQNLCAASHNICCKYTHYRACSGEDPIEETFKKIALDDYFEAVVLENKETLIILGINQHRTSYNIFSGYW